MISQNSSLEAVRLFICKARFTTGFLLTRYLNVGHSRISQIKKHMLDNEEIVTVNYMNWQIWLPTPITRDYVMQVSEHALPRATLPSNLPTKTIYHDLLVQYVGTLFANRTTCDVLLFDSLVGNQSAYRPDCFVSFQDKTKDPLLIEIELHAKNMKRIYHKFISLYELGIELEASVVFVFIHKQTLGLYKDCFEQAVWPAYVYANRKYVESGVFNPKKKHLARFTFTLLSDLDDLPDDATRV